MPSNRSQIMKIKNKTAQKKVLKFCFETKLSTLPDLLTHRSQCLSFSGHGSCLRWLDHLLPLHLTINKSFPYSEKFEIFCDNIPMQRGTLFAEAQRCHKNFHTSWLVIIIFSLEMSRVSRPTTFDLVRNTNNTNLFVKFVCSDTLYKLNTTDAVVFISFLVDVKCRIVLLDISHVSQLYYKICLIQELKILSDFVAKFCD